MNIHVLMKSTLHRHCLSVKFFILHEHWYIKGIHHKIPPPLKSRVNVLLEYLPLKSNANFLINPSLLITGQTIWICLTWSTYSVYTCWPVYQSHPHYLFSFSWVLLFSPKWRVKKNTCKFCWNYYTCLVSVKLLKF